MVEFVPALALAALVLKVINLFQYLKARDVNGVGTQLSVWVAGVGALLLVAQTQFAAEIPIGELTLAQLGVWDVIFAGLSLGSTASVVYDVGYKALDNHNSAKVPTLFSPSDRTNTG